MTAWNYHHIDDELEFRFLYFNWFRCFSACDIDCDIAGVLQLVHFAECISRQLPVLNVAIWRFIFLAFCDIP